MPTLTKQQVKRIIDNKPQNITSVQVLQNLVDKGYTIEGLNDKKINTAPVSSSNVSSTSKKGILQTISDAGSNIFNSPKNFLIGQVKDTAKFGLGIGELGSKMLESGYNATIGRLTGREALEGSKTAQEARQSTVLQPTGIAQKLGAFTAELGSFFLPAGKISEGAKAAEMAINASKVAPKFGAGARLLSRASLEAGAAGAVTAGQEGELNKNVLFNTALGAGGEILNKGAQVLSPKLSTALKSSALKNYSQALGATTKENKAISSIVVPELIDRGTTALSRESLLKKANTGLDKAGALIDSVLESIPKNAPINLKNITQQLETAKQQFLITGAGGKMVAADSQAIKNIDGFKDIISQLGDEAAPYESVRRLRQIWDRQISEAKGFFGKTITEGTLLDAKKEATSALRAELAKEFPDMAKANEEYNFWSNVQKVLVDTVQRTQSQRRPLTETIRRTSGALAGGVAGGWGGAIMGDIVMGGITKMVDSTAWKTVSAVNKNKIANFLAEGKTKDALDLLVKILQTSNTQK